MSRLHGVFGSDDRPRYADTQREEREPFDPKFLVYEVFGPPGTVADISFFNETADPEFIEGVSLPWSFTFPLTETSGVGNIAAQGTGSSIGCRIIVDDEVKAERVRQGMNAYTFCLLKAA